MIVSRAASQEAGRDPNTTAEELTETANRLLRRQFITRGDSGGAAHFERVQRHLDYFRSSSLRSDSDWSSTTAGAMWVLSRLRHTATHGSPTQETIVLLCLRLLYSEGAEKGYFIDGSADILVDEEEIQTVYSSLGARRLKPGELREILTQFRRRGLVSFDRSHSPNVDAEVALRPTLLEVVDESFLARIDAWRDAPSPSRSEAVDPDLVNLQTGIQVDAEFDTADMRPG